MLINTISGSDRNVDQHPSFFFLPSLVGVQSSQLELSSVVALYSSVVELLDFGHPFYLLMAKSHNYNHYHWTD